MTSGHPHHRQDHLELRHYRNFPEYRDFRLGNPEVYLQRRLVQLDLMQPDSFEVSGFCHLCQSERKFRVDYLYATELEDDGRLVPNWRERLECESCSMNNRIRGLVHFLDQYCRLHDRHKLYIAEQVTPLFRLLASRFPDIVGSEYLGNTIPYGSTHPETGIRNESINKLSFGNRTFDAIISCDVFEHIPEVTSAFSECFRCLKRGGMLIFSIPFNLAAEYSSPRARIKQSGEIEHLAEPQYHGDPMSDQGCLVFQDFGWDILDKLRQAGFTDCLMHTYWSRELGYLGTEQLLFSARVPRSLFGFGWW